MYQRIFNAPSYSFLVQVSDWNGRHIEYQRIDQYVKPPCREADVQRVANQVDSQLYLNGCKSGLNHYVIAAGPVTEVDSIIKKSNIKLS